MVARFSPLVILIHGLGRDTGSMLPLSWRLARAGFRTQRVGYPSTRGDIATNEAALRRALACVQSEPVDLVGHSLGGLLSARILRDPQGLAIRRVVQIGSPNRGSALADRAARLWPVRRVCGPTVQDLKSANGYIPPHPDIAAIAGTGGWPGLPLARPHDGTVTVRSAWTGAGHRITVRGLHTGLPISSEVAKRVIEFLKIGRFNA